MYTHAVQNLYLHHTAMQELPVMKCMFRHEILARAGRGKHRIMRYEAVFEILGLKPATRVFLSQAFLGPTRAAYCHSASQEDASRIPVKRMTPRTGSVTYKAPNRAGTRVERRLENEGTKIVSVCIVCFFHIASDDTDTSLICHVDMFECCCRCRHMRAVRAHLWQSCRAGHERLSLSGLWSDGGCMADCPGCL